MKTRWALPRCASSGVAAVMRPQAEADSRMTFSPPILGGKRVVMGEPGSWAMLLGQRPCCGDTHQGGESGLSLLGAALGGG